MRPIPRFCSSSGSGRRALATALLALLILRQIGSAYGLTVLSLAMSTVWISALLHGASAASLGKQHGHVVQRAKKDAEHRTNPAPFDRKLDPDQMDGLKTSSSPSHISVRTAQEPGQADLLHSRNFDRERSSIVRRCEEEVFISY